MEYPKPEPTMDNLPSEPEFLGWTTDQVATYVLQHTGDQTFEVISQVKDIFKNNKVTGKRLSELSPTEWKELVKTIVPILELPAVEMEREQHPVVNKVEDIPSKLLDTINGIWWTSLRMFERTPQYDAVYKEEEGIWCHSRGGRPYFNPGKWRRYGLYPRVEGETEADIKNIMTTWHVAYHGTKNINIDSIVKHGLIPPGTMVDGKVIRNVNGHAGAKEDDVPIYLSPSIKYASHYLYTTPKLSQNGEYVYCVFQVRVRPGSFEVKGNTLSARLWGDKNVIFDRAFGPDELEWLCHDASAVRVTGLMVHKNKEDPVVSIKKLFESHKALTRNARAPGKGKWFWNCGGSKTLSKDGPWTEYSNEENAKIEKAFLCWQSYLYLGETSTETGPLHYFINFEVMEQVRCDNIVLRRRIYRQVIL